MRRTTRRLSKFLRLQSLNDSICGDRAFAVSQNLAHAEFYPFKFYRAYLWNSTPHDKFIFYRSAKVLSYEILLQHGILKFSVRVKF